MLRKITLLVFIFLTGFLLSGCSKKAVSTGENPEAEGRLLINALELDKRPFVVINPHATHKLITLYLDNLPSRVKASTLDIEYLAGNLLKGGRVSLKFPLKTPYVQSFLLGSCSAGGKCSFDTDLTSGTLKNRLEFKDETHVLKTNFVFVDGETRTVDGKIIYTPAKTSQGNQILIDTQGLPIEYANWEKIVSAPIAITAVSEKMIKGELKIRSKEVGLVLIYNGSEFEDLDFETEGDYVVIGLNHQPWSQEVEIVRDDLKGEKETVNVNVLGPVILVGGNFD